MLSNEKYIFFTSPRSLIIITDDKSYIILSIPMIYLFVPPCAMQKNHFLF